MDDHAYQPKLNGAGQPVIPMTAEQKYEFGKYERARGARHATTVHLTATWLLLLLLLADLQGYLILPGILPPEEVGPILEHQLQFRSAPESLPAHERDYHGGPSVALLDHPAVVGVLNEILSYQTLASETSYGFRYDHTGLKYREAGQPQPDASWAPHGGGGIFNFRGNSHIYQMEKQKIHAGLVRVVWELTDVALDSGGTHFIPGR